MNLLALAAFIWLAGLLGFLLFPYRYSVSWYLAGVARLLGIGVIFVGLLREQVCETQRFLGEAGQPVLIKPFTIEQVGRAVSEVLAGTRPSPPSSSTTRTA